MITRRTRSKTVCYDVRYNDQFRHCPTETNSVSRKPDLKILSIADEVDKYKAEKRCADAAAKNLKNKLFSRGDDSKRNTAVRKIKNRIIETKIKVSFELQFTFSPMYCPKPDIFVMESLTPSLLFSPSHIPTHPNESIGKIRCLYSLLRAEVKI